MLLEAKISEAKMMNPTLKARIAAAKVNGQLQSTVGPLGINSVMGAFERMEEKGLQMEARSQAAEIAGADLESQFAMLEPSSDVDDELAAMKALLTGPAQQVQLEFSGSKPSNSLAIDAVVDAELEDLKRQLDSL